MLKDKLPRIPTLLLLVLLALSCGIMLINTLSDNVAGEGLHDLKQKHLDQKQAYDLAK
jgi:hypothetical protein